MAERWRSERWDTFCLVLPNWTFDLPGFSYEGPDRDGYLNKQEIITRFEQYVFSFDPPLREGIEVRCLQKSDSGFEVKTNEGSFFARNVVVATGPFQKPKIPPFASKVDSRILQIHSRDYRNPSQLNPGAVLVVGTGQSGSQIADEIHRSGRKTYLCVSRCKRTPRRYRGRDIAWWFNQPGSVFDETMDSVPASAHFACNGMMSGHNGGEELNLREFARQGITLLGRLQGVDGERLEFAEDLISHLEFADKEYDVLLDRMDRLAEQNSWLLDPPGPRNGTEPFDDIRVIQNLDMDEAGITNIIWGTGFRLDYDWIQFPIFDSRAYPRHQRGVTEIPGLYFIGLPWQRKKKSSLLVGIRDDAEFIADQIVKNVSQSL